MILNSLESAAIGAIHAACGQTGRFESLATSTTSIYGIRTEPANRFGYLAAVFAKNALEGAVTGDELIA